MIDTLPRETGQICGIPELMLARRNNHTDAFGEVADRYWRGTTARR
jgi:hypothetical protein